VAHDRTGAATGLGFVKRRLAEDTVPPMHPDLWWACAVGGVPLQGAAKSSQLIRRIVVCCFVLLTRR